jgi:hypothetical protein
MRYGQFEFHVLASPPFDAEKLTANSIFFQDPNQKPDPKLWRKNIFYYDIFNTPSACGGVRGVVK